MIWITLAGLTSRVVLRKSTLSGKRLLRDSCILKYLKYMIYMIYIIFFLV